MHDNFLRDALVADRRARKRASHFRRFTSCVAIAIFIVGGFVLLTRHFTVSKQAPISPLATLQMGDAALDSSDTTDQSIKSAASTDASDTISSPPVTPQVTNPSQDQQIANALVHKDRRIFRDAATEAAGYLTGISHQAEKDSWESMSEFKNDISDARLKIPIAVTKVAGVKAYDKDPTVMAQEQQLVQQLMLYSRKIQDTVDAYYDWTNSTLPSSTPEPKSTSMDASQAGIDFYHMLDGLSI